MEIALPARTALSLAFLSVASSTLTAQCTTVATSLGGYPGAASFVYATCMWDADGSGPAPNLLVSGGIFSNAGTVSSQRIAAFDPATGTWSGFAGGMTSAYAEVQALAALPNGNLVAAGYFSVAGGVAVNNIAQWNGTTWAPLGSGISNGANLPKIRLAVLPNGDLVAAGWFNVAGGIAVNNVARWNGSTWTSLGGPFTEVGDLEVAPNGDLLVTGWNGLWRWNGNWSAVPGFTGFGLALAVAPNGDIFVHGGSPSGVYRIVGGQGTLIGTPNQTLGALTATSTGDLIAGGSFSAVSGIAANRIARWNGTTWSALGSGLGTLTFDSCRTITEMPGGGLAAGGNFLTAGGIGSENLARWNGTAWLSFGGGANDLVRVAKTLPDGSLVAGGNFTTLGGAAVNCVGRRVNGTWQTLGSGISGAVVSPGPYVSDVVARPNGDLVVCGAFLQAGGQTMNSVARWNGSAWVAMGTGLRWSTGAAFGYCAAAMPNGDIVVGGDFTSAGGVPALNIARWNGSWSPVGTGTTNPVLALLVRPSGDLIAAFQFYGLMSWNGSFWSNIGMNGGQRVNALANLADGGVVAGGYFTSVGGLPANNVARWNGTSWSALGNGLVDMVVAVRELPGGDLLAACQPQLSATRVWRWHGGAWSPVAALASLDGNVSSLDLAPNGDVVIGGAFQNLGSIPAQHLAALRSTCPASAVVVPTACSRPSGALTLTSSALPWVGGTAAARGSAFAANGVALAVAGTTAASLPLTVVDPSAGANCALLANPDVVEFVPVAAGAATWQLAIPATASLVGVQIHHQMVEVALGPSALAGVYGSNGLRWTLGVW